MDCSSDRGYARTTDSLVVMSISAKVAMTEAESISKSTTAAICDNTRTVTTKQVALLTERVPFREDPLNFYNVCGIRTSKMLFPSSLNSNMVSFVIAILTRSGEIKHFRVILFDNVDVDLRNMFL